MTSTAEVLTARLNQHPDINGYLHLSVSSVCNQPVAETDKLSFAAFSSDVFDPLWLLPMQDLQSKR